jgi:hypothetical protein
VATNRRHSGIDPRSERRPRRWTRRDSRGHSLMREFSQAGVARLGR